MGIQIQAVKKCGFLRQLAEQAKAIPSALKPVLLAAQNGHFSGNFSRGRLTVSTSGAGQSGSFEISVNGKEWTQDNIFGLIEELIQLLDYTVDQGTLDGGTIAETDALFAQMLDNINTGNVPQIGIREQMGDFSGLNFPSTSLR